MKIIKGSTLTSAELADKFWDMQWERHDNPNAFRGLRFFHPELDEITGGLRREEFLVIAGAQKAGKTMVGLALTITFAQQLEALRVSTDNVEKEEKPEQVLFISLEMSHDAIAGRVISNLGMIDSSKFRDYRLEGEDWTDFKEATEQLKELPILWNVGAYTLEGIEAIVEEENIRVLVIDYFQLLSSGPGQRKRYEALEELSRKLKTLSISKKMSVLVLSQQTRESLKSISLQKDPNTIAGTQGIARDVDMLLILLPFMKDGEEVPHKRQLHLALSRNSAMGITVPIMFFPQHARIGAPAEEDLLPRRPEMGKDQIVFWEKAEQPNLGLIAGLED